MHSFLSSAPVSFLSLFSVTEIRLSVDDPLNFKVNLFSSKNI